MLRQFRIALFVFAGLTLFLGSELGAQTRADLAKQIQQLDRNIERARELVASFDNQRALALVNEASRLRDEAVRLIQSDSPTSRDFIQAAANIKLANANLLTAARLTLEGPVRRLRSQLEELLIRADDVVVRSGHRESQRLLDEAKKNREAGERAASVTQVQKAVEHFRVGITLAERAIHLASGSGDADIDKLREERRKFENLRERALEILDAHPNDRARQVYQQAVSTARSAENAFNNRNIELARRLLNQSVLLMLRAIDLAQPDAAVAVGRLESELFQLKDLLERSRELISGGGNPRVVLLLRRAQRLSREAEAAVGEGRSDEAITKIGLARNMLRRVDRLAGADQPRQFNTKVTEEIEKTRNDIATVQSGLRADAPQEAAVFVRMAEWALRRAEKASTAGLNRVALEAVLASQRFLTRAERLTSGGGDEAPSRAQTQIRLGQLDAAISEAEQESGSKSAEWGRQLLESAKGIQRLANDSFDQGNYRAANEAIQISFELLRKISKGLTSDR